MNFFVFALINKIQGRCVPFFVIGLIIPLLFGPLTFWPNVEFWWPEIQIFGALSVGTLLLLLTIAGFMGISIVLLIYGWRSSTSKSFGVKAVGSTTGSSMAITATSFCCCCLPVLYPILALLVGSTAAESLTLLLVNSSGPLFNLIQMAILSLMAVTAISAADRLNRVFSSTCELGN
jgi:hypothetical protein